MDLLILRGVGGFTARAEFIREAVEAMVLETSFQQAPEGPTPESSRQQVPTSLTQESPPPVNESPSPESEWSVSLESLEGTRLPPVPAGYVVEQGVAVVSDNPMFGLHNRDYPSIWAASQIASLTREGPKEIEAVFETVVKRAWQYAKRLAVLERAINRKKLTALFPANDAKPQSAASAFLQFAIGKYDTRTEGGACGMRLNAEGPLFAWRVLQIQPVNGSLLAGITEPGYKLLNALSGIGLDLPHSEEASRWFCDHLRRTSPGDWSGFSTLLNACRDGASRAEVTDAFCRSHPEWSAKKAGNYLTGYVARAREWGLLKPKLVNHQYELTTLGQEQATYRENRS